MLAIVSCILSCLKICRAKVEVVLLVKSSQLRFPTFFLYNSSSWEKIMLHTENQLPRLPGMFMMWGLSWKIQSVQKYCSIKSTIILLSQLSVPKMYIFKCTKNVTINNQNLGLRNPRQLFLTLITSLLKGIQKKHQYLIDKKS